MKKKFVTPNPPNKTVRHPSSLHALKPEGEWVEVDSYWTRRAKDGDVVIADEAPAAAPAPAPEPDPAPAPAEGEGDEGTADVSAAVDWEFVDALVAEGDKAGLDEYAKGFGVDLDRRKSAENMAAAFRESVESAPVEPVEDGEGNSPVEPDGPAAV